MPLERNYFSCVACHSACAAAAAAVARGGGGDPESWGLRLGGSCHSLGPLDAFPRVPGLCVTVVCVALTAPRGT
jgi:hypothetical protein